MPDIYVLLSHQVAQQQRLNAVADNVANVNTTGFKRGQVSFSEYLGAHAATPIASYAKVEPKRLDPQQGAIQTTGNPFDFAVKGDGLFAIRRNNATLYTRDGQFALSSDGKLVTNSGDIVLDGNTNPITIPRDKRLEISSDGSIFAIDGAARSSVGKIAVWDVADKNSLIRTGDAFVATTPVTPIKEPILINGAIEASNVNAIEESVHLTELSRSFELTSNMMQRLEDTQLRTIRQLGQQSQ